MRTRVFVATSICLLTQFVSVAAYAELTLTTFTSGTAIKASEVNQNFEALRSKIGATNVILGDGWASVAAGTTRSVVIGGEPDGGENQILAGAGPTWGGTISGGLGNRISGNLGTVAGGQGNQANGFSAATSGGRINLASGDYATVVGGYTNTASGSYSAALGGSNNTAAGSYAVALGRRAKANSNGCFVWADSTDADINCSANNRWVARASGGVYFYSNSGGTTGVNLAAGSGTWASVSDRNQKKDFLAVDPKSVLERVRALPISTWRYLSEESGATHMGPMAQDFHAAFGLGDSDKTITGVDADGVALAAVQGLDTVTRQRMSELEREVKTLRNENDRLRSSQEDLDARLARVERGLGGKTLVQTNDMLGSPWTMGLGAALALGLAVSAARRRRS